MKFMFEILDGPIWAMMGAIIAIIVAGIGSSRGVGLAGQAAAGVITEDPSKFGRVMILQLLPSTQTIYGFVIAFLIINKVSPELTLGQGFVLFMAGLPVGIVGLVSGIYQGKVATAGINMVAKRPEGMIKGAILALMVEFFAILAFVISMLMFLTV